MTGERLFRLEYGEAHVAIRLGNPPEQLDNVVQKFLTLGIAPFASEEYLDRHPLPETAADLKHQKFIAFNDENVRAPFGRWMKDNIPNENVVFRTSDVQAMKYLAIAGAGVGFVGVWEARQHPELVQIWPAMDEWSVPAWLVTHVDLHRTPKVQAMLSHLKAEAKKLEDV